MVNKNIYKLKTSSIWGYPPKRFFEYLNMLNRKKLPKTLCVLGCSDGRYVIPAAKRGFKVCAIDFDKTAIFGGGVVVDNKKVNIKGLIKRLEDEGLKEHVKVVGECFIKYNTSKTFSGVFTSGSIQYTENNQYSPKTIIDKIKSYVSVGGILLFEWIHSPEIITNSVTRYFTANQIKSFFNEPEWTVISNKVKKYIEPPNPRNPSTHKIAWGRLYATRNK